MKKLEILLLIGSLFLLAGCTLFEVEYTPEILAEGYGRPDFWYEFPAETTFILPNPVSTTFFADNMNGGQFGMAEIQLISQISNDTIVQNNPSISALIPWPDKASLTYNAAVYAQIAAGDKWAATADNYPTNHAAVYNFWATDTAGFPWWGTAFQTDGGDSEGVWVDDGPRRHAVVVTYNVAEILFNANYIADAILAYYYVIVESYKSYQKTGCPVTVFDTNGFHSWIPAEASMEQIKLLVGRYGKTLGINYVEGKLEGIGDNSTTWIYPDYDFNPGYFVPYSEY